MAVREAVTIRGALPQDSEVCGRICFEAFSEISRRHGFPCDLPGPEAGVGLLASMFADPDFYCVVAEIDGRVVGSNCLDERSVIAGVGPITVELSDQSAGVGRALMRAVMDRAAERGALGMRLVQAAFHNRSLSLYAGLGFDVREPLTCFQGRTRERAIAGYTVRAATPADFDACNALSRRVHGFDRGIELREATEEGLARVVEDAGRIVGYAADLAFFNHATAESNDALKALIASAEELKGPGILVPSRNAELFRWCLQNGLRVVQPMTLMSLGMYQEPAGAWLPSVVF